MSGLWHYRMFGQEFGPVPIDELKLLVEQATISQDDDVRRDDSPNWVTAGSVPELGLVQATQTPAMAGSPASAGVNAQSGSDDWYYNFFGQEMGPVGFDELASITERGQLSADDEVKLGAAGKWRRVGSIGRLVAVLPFEAAQPKAPAIPISPPPPAPPRAAPVAVTSPLVAQQPAPPATIGPRNPAMPRSTASLATVAGAAATIPPGPAPLNSAASGVAVKPAIVAPAKPEPATAPVMPAEVARTAPEIPPPPSNRSAGFSTPAMSPPPASFGSNRPAYSKPSAYSSPKSSGASSEGLIKLLKIVGGVVVVGMVVLLAGWLFQKSGSGVDVARYQSLKKLLDDVRAARAAKSTDFEDIKKRANKFNYDYVPALKVEASADRPEKQALLWATRDDLPKMMSSDLSQETIHEKNFAARLADAAKILRIK